VWRGPELLLVASTDGRNFELSADFLSETVIDLGMTRHGSLPVSDRIADNSVSRTLPLDTAAVKGQMPHQLMAFH
jgi:hypothetical protein